MALLNALGRAMLGSSKRGGVIRGYSYLITAITPECISRDLNAADVSNVMASRDLSVLVKSGMLISKGEKRGRVYTASRDLRNVYLKIRGEEPNDIGDPFIADAELITA
jgi:hypothetical protein